MVKKNKNSKNSKLAQESTFGEIKTKGKKVFKLGIMLAIVTGFLVLFGYLIVRNFSDKPIEYTLTISPETTVITEPLLAGGDVDYLSIIERSFENVTPASNAVIPLLDIIGIEEFQFGSVKVDTKKLSYQSPLDQRELFVVLEKYPLGKAGDLSAMRKALGSSWSLENAKLLASWVAVNSKSLDAIVVASMRKKWYLPMFTRAKARRLTHSDSYKPVALLEAGWALIARAMLSMNAGDFASGRNDLLAVHQLCRLLWQDWRILSHTLGYQLEIAASKGWSEAAREFDIPADQLDLCIRGIDELSQVPTLVSIFDISERYILLDTAQSLWQDDASQSSDLAADIDSVLRKFNAYFDRVVEAAAMSDRQERKILTVEHESEFTLDLRLAESTARHGSGAIGAIRRVFNDSATKQQWATAGLFVAASKKLIFPYSDLLDMRDEAVADLALGRTAILRACECR